MLYASRREDGHSQSDAMKKPIHRVTPNSKAGRRMTSGGGIALFPNRISNEILDWNAAVEYRKAIRKSEKKSIKVTP